MTDQSSPDVLIVGAGVAGLSLGRRLQELGRSPLLLERAAAVGGRCTSWTVEGHRVDPGVPLLHGASSLFRQAVGGLLRCGPVPDWPLHVRGSGTPCQPQAYGPRSLRLALAEGIGCFPGQLAEGLRVELETEALRAHTDGTGFVVESSRGERRGAALVLTCPVEQTVELLDGLGGSAGPELPALRQALRTIFTVPCLALVAGYPDAAPLDFHLQLPGTGSPIHSLINDSSKRPGQPGMVLVLQAQPGFSRERLGTDQAVWVEELLAAAGRLLGDWAARPAWTRAHSWQHARLQRGSELRHPVLLRWPGGACLGICGEAWSPAGGVEGAYLSGLELAARIASGAATTVEGD